MDAVCLDGTPPAYHLDPGHGAGKNRWIVNLQVLNGNYVNVHHIDRSTMICNVRVRTAQGGGWCDSVSACLNRKASSYGSSNRMDKQMNFVGILSSSPVDNPGLFPLS